MAVVAVAPSVVAGTAAEEETMIIKKSCALRSTYEVQKEVYMTPLQVVPHPLNRGGDPVKVLLRCRSITKNIAMYDCDDMCE